MLLGSSGKELFRDFGIPTPDGYVVSSEKEILPVTKPMMVKAQVQVGGRGKAGESDSALRSNKSRERPAKSLTWRYLVKRSGRS